jgi:16S rRNA (cytosine1402-N4)-methyltransferase
MRMDVRSHTTASEVLNTYSMEELAKVFRSYGEVSNARAVAMAVDKARKQGPLLSTVDLEEAIKRLIPRGQPSKFLARIYQALRIEVNAEMDALKEMLLQTTELLVPGGRLVVITYHSLEDRLVKNFMRSGNLEGEITKDFYGQPLTPWKLVNRNVITASEEELGENKRARSAKLRIAERKK